MSYELVYAVIHTNRKDTLMSILQQMSIDIGPKQCCQIPCLNTSLLHSGRFCEICLAYRSGIFISIEAL